MQWLLDTLTMGEGILDALWFWLDELVPGVVGSPITLKPEESGLSDDHKEFWIFLNRWAMWGKTTLC